MKTPYYSGTFTAAQHTGLHDDDQLRERMLEHRLANRDDVRDIWIVTALPFSERLKNSPAGRDMVKKASKNSKNDLSWAMHWAVQVGDQYFELQRGYPDPLRTGLRMSQWDQHKQSQIHQRYRQGVTAMTDDEIRAVGERHFSRLERIDLNIYSLWCNNCQVAVDHMLRDIGGLFYYRAKIESLHEMVKQFFYNSILNITRLYGRYRGWNEEVITQYTAVLNKTLRVMTSRSEYPKRHWIRQDIETADGVLKKVGTVKDHWLLTVLESSLSLRKPSEDLYVRRGNDGKPELNFDALKEATKGIFDDDQKKWHLAWLKAVPYLTAGFMIGTPRWAAAVISIALSRASQLYEERVGLKGGLEDSLASVGMSPNPQYAASTISGRPTLRNQRTVTNGQRRVRTKTLSIDNRLVPRYERCQTAAGVPYFFDHMKKSRSWDAPDQQEMCLRISTPPLSKKWDEKQEDGGTVYVNRISGVVTATRPGPTEIWAIKKRVKPDWVKSTVMALPCGWEMRRTEDGEMYYLNQNDNPPKSTTSHPMRQEIEDERRVLLPEFWNVEWDSDRGKKYRNIQTGELRWKAVDGPRCVSGSDKARITLGEPPEGFVEPLPPGWTVSHESDGQKIYKNGKVGKERLERRTHPSTDKRRRLQPGWEMRYTRGNRRYWIHHGADGRGTSWWTRNRLLKNTSLKNNASGWKLTSNGLEWEWFEGGDVPHSEIPVLDLDDPADIEFREYPFILPPRLTTEDRIFIEPLPADWVVRKQDDGSIYYWNFKDEVRSDQHPHEEERRNLPALWEMRFTRHGRQYFIHHEDGSTWWTHPGKDKYERQQRARPGQSQDGWKLAEDGKTWERFEDHPDAEDAEQTLEMLSHTQSGDGEPVQNEHDAEKWRSLSFTRDWLKKANSSDIVTTARASIPRAARSFKKSDKSPIMDSTCAISPPQEDVGDEELVEEEWLVDSPPMTEEPQSSEELEQDHPLEKAGTKRSWPPIRDPRNMFKKTQEFARMASSLLENPHEAAKEDMPIQEGLPIHSDAVAEEMGSIGDTNMTNPPLKEVERSTQTSDSTSPQPKEVELATEEKKPMIPAQKEGRKGWAKRTSSNISALKKRIAKKGGESSTPLSNGRDVVDSDPEPSVEGLGISNAEGFDDEGGTAILPAIEEQVDGEENGIEGRTKVEVEASGNESMKNIKGEEKRD